MLGIAALRTTAVAPFVQVGLWPLALGGTITALFGYLSFRFILRPWRTTAMLLPNRIETVCGGSDMVETMLPAGGPTMDQPYCATALLAALE